MLLAALALLPAGVALVAPADHVPYCYTIGGQSVFGASSASALFVFQLEKDNFDPATNETQLGQVATKKSDAAAYWWGTGTLYAINTVMSSRLGTLGIANPATGTWSALPNAIGNADAGPDGAEELFDVSGLSFDPATGHLYATHVRTTAGGHVADLLFKIDVNTGRHVNNGFSGPTGAAWDYVKMVPLAAHPSLSDIDDIAFDPTDGQLYGVANNSSTPNDRLVQINKQTGALTDVGPFGVGEVEGMDFDPHGRLFITAGGDEIIPNQVYEVNKATGAAASPRIMDNSFDYEAIACMLSAPATPVSPTAVPTTPAPTEVVPTIVPPTATPQPTARPDVRLTQRVLLPIVGQRR
jgi:hypothetical protein